MPLLVQEICLGCDWRICMDGFVNIYVGKIRSHTSAEAQVERQEGAC